MPSYLRWGQPSHSQARIREMQEKAKEFKKGDAVLVQGRKGTVQRITHTGGIMVKIGHAPSRQFHPDQVQKLNT